jgi:hypothetical protein
MAAASRSRRNTQRRPTRLAGRSPRRASSYTVERGMPSRSATSLVDMTSVRVNGRAAGEAIYLREARSRQSGPPGVTSAGASGPFANGGCSAGSTGIQLSGLLVSDCHAAGCRNHAKATRAPSNSLSSNVPGKAPYICCLRGNFRIEPRRPSCRVAHAWTLAHRAIRSSPPPGRRGRLRLQAAAPATAWSAPQPPAPPHASGPNAASGPASGRSPKPSTALPQRRDAEHPAGHA